MARGARRAARPAAARHPPRRASSTGSRGRPVPRVHGLRRPASPEAPKGHPFPAQASAPGHRLSSGRGARGPDRGQRPGLGEPRAARQHDRPAQGRAGVRSSSSRVDGSAARGSRRGRKRAAERRARIAALCRPRDRQAAPRSTGVRATPHVVWREIRTPNPLRSEAHPSYGSGQQCIPASPSHRSPAVR